VTNGLLDRLNVKRATSGFSQSTSSHAQSTAESETQLPRDDLVVRPEFHLGYHSDSNALLRNCPQRLAPQAKEGLPRFRYKLRKLRRANLIDKWQLLAESLVDEWLNRQGFFTIRGVKHGVGEIDLLAIRAVPGVHL